MKCVCRMMLIPGIFLVIFNLLPMLSMAQTPDDPGGDPDAPIDGGLGILVAAGVGYGVKKVRENRKKKNQDSTVSI